MNYVVLVIAVAGFLLNEAIAEQTSSGPNNKLGAFLYERCRLYSTNAADYDKLKIKLDEFMSYLNYTANLLPNGQKQFCMDERPILISTVAELAKNLKHCLPSQEKYLPQFMLESFMELLNFICSAGNIDNYFSTQGRECRTALKQNQEGGQVGGCFSDLFPRKDDYLHKDDLCRNIKSAKRCFGMSLARSCPNFAAYTNLNDRFFDNIRKPCNSALAFSVNSLVVMIVAFVTTKIFS